MEMKTLPLPTETPEQREIVRALIEAKSERLRGLYNLAKDIPDHWFTVKNVISEKVDNSVFKHYQFRLTLPDVTDHRQSGEVNDRGQCTCGFDAEGWRGLKEGEIQNEGDQYKGDHAECDYYEPYTWEMLCKSSFGSKVNLGHTLIYRTRRHKADCPSIQPTTKTNTISSCEREGKKEYDVFMEVAKDAQKLCTSEPHAKETAICEHEFNPTMGLGWQNNNGSGFGNYCQKCGEYVGDKIPEETVILKIPKPAVEPFSLEEDLTAWRNSMAWNPLIDSIISKIEARINQMEEK